MAAAFVWWLRAGSPSRPEISGTTNSPDHVPSGATSALLPEPQHAPKLPLELIGTIVRSTHSIASVASPTRTSPYEEGSSIEIRNPTRSKKFTWAPSTRAAPDSAGTTDASIEVHVPRSLVDAATQDLLRLLSEAAVSVTYSSR